jgi:PAS domain S-box-containing protein
MSRKEVDLRQTVVDLEARLSEAEALVHAIRSGDVDALVVAGPDGDQVFTLKGAEHHYRVLVEAMSEGAVILTVDRSIYYSNRSFAAMLAAELDEVIGSAMDRFVLPEDLLRYQTLIDRVDGDASRGEIRLTARGGRIVPVYLSINPLESAAAGSVCAVVTDLTQHRRHQELISAEALERTKRTEAEAGQRRIAKILESITDSFFSLDRTWRITDANQRAAANFGKTRSELIGAVLWDISQQGNVLESEEQYRKAMTDGVPVHCEGQSAIAEGKWFEEHIYPTPEGLEIYFRDVTERRRVQHALRTANERVEMILDSITDRFFAFDKEWRFTYFNRHAEDQVRVLGKDPATLIGKITWEVFDADPVVEASFRRAQIDQTVTTNEQFYSPLGEWVENRVYPSPDGGVAVFQRYITDRKRAEAELRRSEALLTEGQRISHTGSWVWNVADGRLIWSPEHYRICGVDPAAFTLTLETAQRLIHPDDLAFAKEGFERLTALGRVFEADLRFVRPDGTIRYVHSVGHPVFNDRAEVTECVGTVLDLTERKEEELARQDLLRRLVVAQEDERRRIALEMHDQFGQQLSALVLMLSTLKRECGRRTNLGQQIASLEEMTRQLDTDLELIVSRLHPPALDDLGLVPALTNYVKRWSAHFDIHADLHAFGMEPGLLTNEIDTALYRITQEALNNIAKHARAEHVAVLLDGRPDRVSLIVEDDGIGFDVDHPVGPRQRFGVIGMRERATLLGGTLDVESNLGRGATVIARIPVGSSPAQGRR